jgi:TonB family protein
MTVFLLATSTFAQTPPTDRVQINALADRVARDIQTAPRKSKVPQKLLVASFTTSASQPSVLGQQLADELSAALEARFGPDIQLPRKQFLDRMTAAGIGPSELANHNVVNWQAAQAGANLIITGTLSTGNMPALLSVSLSELPDVRELSVASAEIPIDPGAAKRIDTALLSPGKTEAASGDRAAVGGVTQPTCQYCPAPAFTDAARKAKYQGAATVLLKVTVDQDGHVLSTVVLIGAPYGLDGQAVDKVRQWHFNPSTKDGKPITVAVQVEVTFRRY